MASASHLRERRASLSPPIDAMSTAPDHNVPDSEEGDLPQSSQSSRIVSVPRNAAQAGASLAIAKIEAIFESMVDVLTGGNDTLSIPYRNRNTPQRPLGTLKFPGRNMTEATKFTQMMRVMELSHDALMSGRLITKRNIYYQNPELFKNQSIVDQLVDDLACTLAVGRNGLNIAAASKGLIAGPLRLIMTDGSVLSSSSDHDISDSIPPISTIHQIDFANTRWILIIEKEARFLTNQSSPFSDLDYGQATFRTLSACQYWRTCAHGQGIIVTGKGYADLATLEFLNLAHTLRPLMPLLCVVDCDPHGVDIMRTYKHGSKGLGHEVNTRVPGLHWLGIKMGDIFLATNRLSTVIPDARSSQEFDSQSNHSPKMVFSQSSGTSSSQPGSRLTFRAQRTALDSLMQLTPSDRKTTHRILLSIMGEDEEEAELDHEDLEQLRELQVMLVLNMKAEIQAIDNMGDLSSWLDEKMGMV